MVATDCSVTSCVFIICLLFNILQLAQYVELVERSVADSICIVLGREGDCWAAREGGKAAPWGVVGRAEISAWGREGEAESIGGVQAPGLQLRPAVSINQRLYIYTCTCMCKISDINSWLQQVLLACTTVLLRCYWKFYMARHDEHRVILANDISVNYSAGPLF